MLRCSREWFGDTKVFPISGGSTVMAKIRNKALKTTQLRSVGARCPNAWNYPQILLIGFELGVFTQIINNYLTVLLRPLIKWKWQAFIASFLSSALSTHIASSPVLVFAACLKKILPYIRVDRKHRTQCLGHNWNSIWWLFCIKFPEGKMSVNIS